VGAINDNTLTYEMVKSNIVVFFLAGHETTSTSIQYCLYHLAKNPEYQTRLREEILKDFPVDDLDYEKVKDFNMIGNMVNESLRLFTPLPYLPARVALEDTTAGDWFIPKGCQVSVNVWKVSHDKEIWGEDAFEFNPDRFNNLTPDQRKAFLSFGGGPRICIGMNFSLLEQKILFIKLLKKYEVTFGEGSELEVSTVLFSPNGEKLKWNFKPINV